MGNKLIIVITLFFACGMVSAWEIEDINGTWVDNEDFLSNRNLPKREYSWGTGETLPNFSIDIDLGKKEVYLNGMGLYIIDTVFKNEQESICLILFYVGDEKSEFPLNMEVSFIDYHEAYIVCYPQEGWSNYTLSPEKRWVWYRLSGPPR